MKRYMSDAAAIAVSLIYFLFIAISLISLIIFCRLSFSLLISFLLRPDAFFASSR